MYKAEALLHRQGLSHNEIQTLMWRVGVELPEAFDVRVQNLLKYQRNERRENAYYLKVLGRYRVEKERPQV